MLRKFLVICILFVHVGFITSCSKDEPKKPGVENPDNPDDPNNPDVPNTNDDLNVVVYSDGSTSTGVRYDKIDETTFLLNYIKYRIDNGHINVIGHDDAEVEYTLKGNVVIPESITISNKQYLVRKIESYAFRESKGLRNVRVPETIVSIEFGAFKNSSLETINIPHLIEEIEIETFIDSQLQSIELPGSIKTIKEWAFAGTKLESLEIPNGVIGTLAV